MAYIAGFDLDAVELSATSFHCRVCQLALAAELLAPAELVSMTIPADAYDLEAARAFFRRMEADDEWYDD